MSRAALYVCYEDVREPLVWTQVIAYLRGLARAGYEIHLLTFDKGRLPEADAVRVADRLARDGIRWSRLKYHKRPSLAATVFDVFAGAARIRELAARHGVRILHGRSHVATAAADRARRATGAKVLFDLRGLLADEYVDAGHWRAGGLKYRLTKRMERQLLRRADAIVMLTEAVKRHLLATEAALHGREHVIEVIPCCVDLEKFPVDAVRAKAARRRAGGPASRCGLVYVGKLGFWYLTDEMARFAAALHEADGRVRFTIATQSDPTPMRAALESHGVPADAFDVAFVAVDEMPGFLESADLGLAFYRSSFSKISTSPTKIGEYLAAGVPVIASAGIGDCDAMLTRPHLGLTVARHDAATYRDVVKRVLPLIENPAAPEACRAYAERELSLAAVGIPRYAAVYARLSGTHGEVGAG